MYTIDKLELSHLLYNHTRTEEEKDEVKRMINAVEAAGFKDVYGIGFPCSPTDRGPGEGYVYSGFDNPLFSNLYIEAIKHQDDGDFDYYLVEGLEKGQYSIYDFQEDELPKYEAQCQIEYGKKADPRNCFLYFLIIKAHVLNYDDSQKFVLYKGYCLKAIKDEESGKYRLELIIPDGVIYKYDENSVEDDIIRQILSGSKPIYTYMVCPACYHSWIIDDSGIPDGHKYEVQCQKCGTLIMRIKKIIKNE